MGTKVSAERGASKPHCSYTSWKDSMNVKMSASEKPERSEQHSTMGSRARNSNCGEE
jgi:hypothetical protein